MRTVAADTKKGKNQGMRVAIPILLLMMAIDGPSGIGQDPSVPKNEWIKYEEWTCDAGNTEECDHSDTFEAPEGWQACRFLYQEASKANDAWVKVTPSSWYTNDSEHPWRFRAYIAAIHARGDHKIFGAGAWITLRNVGISYIPSWANNRQRFDADCDMPPSPSQ